MLVICGWCKKVLGEVEGDIGEVSHGICKVCSKKLKKESGLKAVSSKSSRLK